MYYDIIPTINAEELAKYTQTSALDVTGFIDVVNGTENV